MLFTDKRCERPAQIIKFHQVGFYTTDPDGGLDAEGDMIRIIADPNRHFFTGVKHTSFYQEWFYLDRVELPVFGIDDFLTHIPNVRFVELVIEKQLEIDFIAWMEV